MKRDMSELHNALNSLLEELGSAGDSGPQEILSRYLDLERSLLTQYREILAERLEDQSTTRMMQGMTKLMMTSFVEAAAFQRDTQQRLLETQSRFAERYLSFLDRVSDQVHSANGSNGSNGTPEGEDGE